MSGIRLVAIVASLVLLGVILSPVSPFTLLQGKSGQGNSPAEVPIDEEKIAPAEVTQEDFAECNSINDGVQVIVAGDGTNETRKLAADLLVGEYCNRPELVHEISAAGDPGLSLVAYACDAASHRAGDSVLQDSLADHTVIYCESARDGISDELESLELAIEAFREDFLAELQAADPGDGSAAYDVEAIRAELDNVALFVEESKSLIVVEKYYESAQKLDTATNAFDSLLGKVENI